MVLRPPIVKICDELEKGEFNNYLFYNDLKKSNRLLEQWEKFKGFAFNLMGNTYNL